METFPNKKEKRKKENYRFSSTQPSKSRCNQDATTLTVDSQISECNFSWANKVEEIHVSYIKYANDLEKNIKKWYFLKKYFLHFVLVNQFKLRPEWFSYYH